MQAADIKQFLYSWCGKQHKIPKYEFSQINSKNKPRFKCEVRVDGINYTAFGNSTNKKDAQTNAALDFCQYLVRIGALNQKDLPVTAQAATATTTSNESGPGTSYSTLPSGIFAPHQTMGLSFNENKSNQMLPYNRGPPAKYLEHVNQVTTSRNMLEDAEETDMNAEIHGFWTIANAKSRLHQYVQKEKMNIDYKYSSTGPDNSRYSLKYIEIESIIR